MYLRSREIVNTQIGNQLVTLRTSHNKKKRGEENENNLS